MADQVSDKVAKLAAACDAAYAAYPNSCSHSVWSVIKAIVDPNKTYEQANSLIGTLNNQWTKVDLATAGKLANQGEVVVGGLVGSPNGHVIVVYPGAAKSRGGYTATSKKGTQFSVRSTGLYPLAMSTSIGSWPGAMSDGDKTVWDPWGDDDTFAKVTFWHKDAGAAKTATATATHARKTMEKHNGTGNATLDRLIKIFLP